MKKLVLATFFLPLVLAAAGCGRGADLVSRLGYCEGYEHPPTSKYILPWQVGVEFTVSQGNCSGLSHMGAQRYAYDVGMAIGTNLYAARAGEVVEVKEDLDDGEGCPEANHVSIRHPDGSVAEYYHLTKNGALVASRDIVRQGQLIAKSGNTGCSGGPHLHFIVYKNTARGTPIPITFRNASNNPKGLQTGGTYRANPFWEVNF